MKTLLKSIFILSILFTCISGCRTIIDYATHMSMQVINHSGQAVRLQLYNGGFIRTNIVIPATAAWYYQLEGTDGPSPLTFDGADSLIVTFADGKKKTDYNCSPLDGVGSIVPDCNKDSVNLFNVSRMISVKLSEHNWRYDYYLNEDDHAEAK